MSQIPEPLRRQLARGMKENEEWRMARLFGPLLVGTVLGGVLAFVASALCDIAGITLSRRTATIVVGGLIGFVGPIVAERLMLAHPDWFSNGFGGDGDKSRPSV
jgi:Mg/Co/Ni transporter MgtE